MKYATFRVDSPPTPISAATVIYLSCRCEGLAKKCDFLHVFLRDVTNITRIANRRDSTHKSAPFLLYTSLFGTINIQLLNCPAGYDVIGILAKKKSWLSGEATAQPIK